MLRRDMGMVLLAIVVVLCGALYVQVSVADDPIAHELPPRDTTLTRITDDGYFKQRPAWSADGKHLVFARHRGTTIFLWLRILESGQEERLTKTEHPEYDAVFSPDGKELLFAYDKASPNQGDIEVHRLDLESRMPTPVAVTEGTLSHEESPCWSPDGKQIAFTSTRHGNQELYVAGRDGKEPLRLTSDPAIDSHPDWSPDGNRIVFSTNRWGDLELASISPDGTGLTRLTMSPGLDDYPVWSPDGKRIAYTSNRDRNLEIYILDPVTGHEENVTRSSAIDNFPAWTPDGRLSFVSNRDAGFDIYVTKQVVGNR
ncbi:MAG: PD40 domain-containing protein [Planctomycetaceae bacterium]|jgi:TolB protein|nr:PD40 domain-containing protein [Planctomycetaceae bacterium]